MFDYSTDKGTIRAYGVIGPYEDGISETDFMRAFDAFGGDDVTIHVNSEGGSVTSGLSIYNQISNYPGKVTVVVDAMAYSIASVFPMAAARIVGNRSSRMMIHNPWAAAIGDAATFRQTAEVLDALADDIAQTYAERTGKVAAYWLDVMAAETYFSSAEAMDAGLLDAVIGEETTRPATRRVAAMVSPAFSTKAKAAQLRLRAARRTK